MQEIIVFIIIGAACGFTIRNMWRKFKSKEECGCGCAGCTEKEQCGSQTRHLISRENRQ